MEESRSGLLIAATVGAFVFLLRMRTAIEVRRIAANIAKLAEQLLCHLAVTAEQSAAFSGIAIRTKKKGPDIPQSRPKLVAPSSRGGEGPSPGGKCASSQRVGKCIS